MIEQKIEKLLNEKFAEEAFQDCFIIEIKLSPGGTKLSVFIDSDSSLTFERCQKISRYLEKYLDEEQWLGERYTLEVSSPGIGRPLKFIRQYKKNIGRKVEVALKEGKTITGTLAATTEDSITVEAKTRVKEGKKKKTELVQTSIPFDNIKQTIVKITF